MQFTRIKGIYLVEILRIPITAYVVLGIYKNSISIFVV